MEQRKQLDPRLEHLYLSNMRCPYCKNLINKGELSCTRCGVHKEQIFNASNERAKEIMRKKTGEKIFMTRTRPHDVSFTKMLLFGLLGAFGVHNFIVGRKKRGWFIVIAWIVFLTFLFIFPYGTPANNYQDIHPIRENFKNSLFPTDFLIAVVLIIWAVDIFGIVLGFFKYPVRLGDVRATK